MDRGQGIPTAASARPVRVEAALRRTQAAAPEPDDTLATYYIELNITRTN